MFKICCKFFILQQNNMSAHSVHTASMSESPHLNLLKWVKPTFISSGLWPLHPDLNPVNYKICGEMQQWKLSPKLYLAPFPRYSIAKSKKHHSTHPSLSPLIEEIRFEFHFHTRHANSWDPQLLCLEHHAIFVLLQYTCITDYRQQTMKTKVQLCNAIATFHWKCIKLW